MSIIDNIEAYNSIISQLGNDYQRRVKLSKITRELMIDIRDLIDNIKYITYACEWQYVINLVKDIDYDNPKLRDLTRELFNDIITNIPDDIIPDYKYKISVIIKSSLFNDMYDVSNPYEYLSSQIWIKLIKLNILPAEYIKDMYGAKQLYIIKSVYESCPDDKLYETMLILNKYGTLPYPPDSFIKQYVKLDQCVFRDIKSNIIKAKLFPYIDIYVTAYEINEGLLKLLDRDNAIKYANYIMNDRRRGTSLLFIDTATILNTTDLRYFNTSDKMYFYKKLVLLMSSGRWPLKEINDSNIHPDQYAYYGKKINPESFYSGTIKIASKEANRFVLSFNPGIKQVCKFTDITINFLEYCY